MRLKSAIKIFLKYCDKISSGEKSFMLLFQLMIKVPPDHLNTMTQQLRIYSSVLKLYK